MNINTSVYCQVKLQSCCYFNVWALSFPQKLECPNVKGQLLVFGATNWDLIGRKEVPKQQGRIVF